MFPLAFFGALTAANTSLLPYNVWTQDVVTAEKLVFSLQI